MTLSAAQSEAGTRTPVITQAGELRGQRQLGIDDAGELDRLGRGQIELNRRLHARRLAGSHHNAIHTATAKPGAVGLKRVLACVKTGEPVGAVFPCCGARLRARGGVAQYDCCAAQRRGVGIREFAGKRAAGLQLRCCMPRCAGQRKGQQQNPFPFQPCHREHLSRQTVGKSYSSPSRSSAGSGLGCIQRNAHCRRSLQPAIALLAARFSPKGLVQAILPPVR
jgi:hypothetical protein